MNPDRTSRLAILPALALSVLLAGGAAAAQTAAKPASPDPKTPAAPAAPDQKSAAAATKASAQPAPEKIASIPTGASEEPFIDVVNVTVVNVDVYVTDKKGNRINGLTRDDFQLFEDGKPITITNFYAVEGGRSVGDDDEEAVAVPAPAAPAPTAPTAIPPAARRDLRPVPPEQRLHLVVYIDNFNIHPFHRNRVMRDLRTFLRDNITRNDEVMLVTYDRSLHVRRNFTSDPDVIAQGLLEQEKVTGSAVTSESERRDVLRRIQESESVNEAQSMARSYAESVFNDLSFSVSALKQMVDMLAGMPGRKAILYVSDGIPMVAGQDVFYAVQGKFRDATAPLTQAFDYDASRRFRELTAQANANRVTFYTIDAGGLRTYSSISAENFDPGQGIYVDQIQIQNLQTPLQVMAEATGGMALLNMNNVAPHLKRIAADFNTYYSLGYSPSHAGDGRYHKIEVKLKKKGLLVRHREGYRDKSPEAQMTDGTLAALQFPYEDNPLGVSLEFGQGTRRDDGLYVMPVLVKIPIGKLELVPRQASQDASLRLFIAAIDAKGDTSEVQQARVPISIPNADVDSARQKFYTYTVSLLMRSGNHKVAVGIRDDAGAQSSFLSRGVNVGS